MIKLFAYNFMNSIVRFSFEEELKQLPVHDIFSFMRVNGDFIACFPLKLDLNLIKLKGLNSNLSLIFKSKFY